MIFIITHYYYLLLYFLLFLEKMQKQLTLHDQCDILGKSNPKLLSIISSIPQIPRILTLSWGSEQLTQNTDTWLKIHKGKHQIFMTDFCILWREAGANFKFSSTKMSWNWTTEEKSHHITFRKSTYRWTVQFKNVLQFNILGNRRSYITYAITVTVIAYK